MLPGDSNSAGFKKADGSMEGSGATLPRSVDDTLADDVDVAGVGGGGTLPLAPVVFGSNGSQPIGKWIARTTAAVVVASSPSGAGKDDASVLHNRRRPRLPTSSNSYSSS